MESAENVLKTEWRKKRSCHTYVRVMWFLCVLVCVYAGQIELFPLSAILKNELIRPLIEFVLHRRLFSLPAQRENRTG